jgi:hypothetical protein
MIMIMIMVLRRPDTRVFRRVGKVRWIERHRHAVRHRRGAGKPRLLRKRTQRPAAGGRGVHERIGNVVPDDLVRRGIEVHARCRNPSWRSAFFHPIDQRRQHIELIGCRSASAVVHIWHRIKPREVLSVAQATELVRHLLLVPQSAEKRRARIARTMIPDDLVAIVDELRDVERGRVGNDWCRRAQQTGVGIQVEVQ